MRNDVYVGIGVLGLNAASRAEEVLCSDSNEYVDEVFDRCADSLPVDQRERVFFECLSAEEAVVQNQCEEADVLIVDPPRKGLEEPVLQLLVRSHETATAPSTSRLLLVPHL
jgi:tRNA/tmRNA/rRNA uracil-C5-methylase (TrmA/RlmC/RlmD family)